MRKNRCILQARTFLLDIELVEELGKLEPGQRSEFVRQAIREKLEKLKSFNTTLVQLKAPVTKTHIPSPKPVSIPHWSN